MLSDADSSVAEPAIRGRVHAWQCAAAMTCDAHGTRGGIACARGTMKAGMAPGTIRRVVVSDLGAAARGRCSAQDAGTRPPRDRSRAPSSPGWSREAGRRSCSSTAAARICGRGATRWPRLRRRPSGPSRTAGAFTIRTLRPPKARRTRRHCTRTTWRPSSSRCTPAPVHIVASSYGGVVALLVARDRPALDSHAGVDRARDAQPAAAGLAGGGAGRSSSERRASLMAGGDADAALRAFVDAIFGAGRVPADARVHARRCSPTICRSCGARPRRRRAIRRSPARMRGA